ncbi:TetR/AcrR family transcriptional regulator [Phreatobacter stygius]|uniref:TetR/AcrR family transcriptional regulator n=1 Tax=Phreatobacter stygius TaxID=1940610 RepID=A0A4D7BD04_9HYPH|nr:TetR/AcrR family transcriptional regulator [Phreatobacter stygius]QCI67256.1 TetR/AcrR family transcriptional regulator [Phreatobacter stygius]
MTDTRTRIIACAFRLFLERGYEGASMADLVQASGLSKGAVYHHFADKDALHDATIQYFILRFFEPGDGTAGGAEATLDAVVQDIWSGYARLLEAISAVVPDIGAYHRFLFSILPKVKPVIAARIGEARAQVAAAARREQDRGRLTLALPPDIIADQCLGLVEGTGLLCLLEGKDDVETAFRRVIGGYLRVLRSGSVPA